MCEYLARRPELPASRWGESRKPLCWLGGGTALPARHPCLGTPSRHRGVPASLPPNRPGPNRKRRWGYATEGERAEALHRINKAIELAEGNVPALARLESFKGMAWREESLLATAERRASVADAELQAQVARRYAYFLGNTGRLEESLGKIEKAVELCKQVGDLEELGAFVAGAGRCYNARAGRLERSLEFAAMARGIAASTHDLELRSWLAMEAEPWFYKGLWHRAVRVVELNLSTAWENGRWNVVLWASGWGAIACLKLNRISDARALLEPAMKTAARRMDDDFCKIYPHIALSQLHIAEGDAAAGLQSAKRALDLAERVTARLEIGAAHRALGQAYEAKGDRQSADELFRRSIDILQTIQSRPELAQSLLAFGRFERAIDRDKAEGLLHSALKAFQRDGSGWLGRRNPKRASSMTASISRRQKMSRVCTAFQPAPTFYLPVTFIVGASATDCDAS